MAPKQSKTMYSMSNLDGTYDDLTVWFNELLTNGTKSIEKYELVQFLASKDRVPLGILKKTKGPRKSQEQCCARNLKEHAQCKNESTEGSEMCKVHNMHPPKWTMKDVVEDIEVAEDAEKVANIETKKAEKEEKKEAKKAAKAAKKAAKKASKKNGDDSESDSEVSEVSSDSESDKVVVKAKVKAKVKQVRVRKARKVRKQVPKKVESESDSEDDTPLDELEPPTQDNDDFACIAFD